MTLSGKKRQLSLLIALAAMVAPGTLLAQGYGPDPFKPYNSQYVPYTYPVGPASPGAGGRGAIMPGMGMGGANRYQDYLDELSGRGRLGTERYGIGMPYYRSAVDPSFDPKGTRQYRPNNEADRTLERTREVITQKYLAYFTEKDPKKRAELLRDYNDTRRRVSRAMSGRRESASRILEAASGTNGARRRSAAEARESDHPVEAIDEAPIAPSRPSPRGLSTGSGRRAGTGSIPPPPPLYGADSNRRTTPRSPTEVLNRARRLDRRDVSRPRAGAPATGTDAGTDRKVLPPPLPPE